MCGEDFRSKGLSSFPGRNCAFDFRIEYRILNQQSNRVEGRMEIKLCSAHSLVSDPTSNKLRGTSSPREVHLELVLLGLLGTLFFTSCWVNFPRCCSMHTILEFY
jgi:hypothetical protein